MISVHPKSTGAVLSAPPNDLFDNNYHIDTELDAMIDSRQGLEMESADICANKQLIDDELKEVERLRADTEKSIDQTTSMLLAVHHKQNDMDRAMVSCKETIERINESMLDIDVRAMQERVEQLEMEIEDAASIESIYISGGGDSAESTGAETQESLKASVCCKETSINASVKEQEIVEQRRDDVVKRMEEVENRFNDLTWLCENSDSVLRKTIEDKEINSRVIADKLQEIKLCEAERRNVGKDLEKELCEIKSSKQMMQSQKRSLQRLKRVAAEKSDSHQLLQQEIEAKDDMISRFAARIQEQEMAYMETAEKNNQERRVLADRVQELKTEVRELMLVRKQLEAAIKAQTRDVEAAQADALKQRRLLETMTAERDELTQKVSAMQQTIDAGKAEIEKVRVELARLIEVEKQRHELVRENEARKEASDNLAKDLEKARADLKKAQSRTAGLKKELVDTRSILEEHRRRAAENEDAICDMERRCGELKQERDGLVAKIDSLCVQARAKDQDLESVKARLEERNAEIDNHKHSLALTVTRGESLFNQISLKIGEYFESLDRFLETQLPSLEETYIRDLDAFDAVCKASIDLKTNNVLAGMSGYENDVFKKLSEQYDESIAQVRQKCSHLELMEMELRDKIRKYEMYDMANAEKTRVISESLDFVQEKQDQLILFKKNVDAIEFINSKFSLMGGSAGLARGLEDVKRRVSEVAGFQAKVESALEKHRRNTERFYAHADVQFLDRLDLIENNIYKIIGVILAQFLAIAVMWIF